VPESRHVALPPDAAAGEWGAGRRPHLSARALGALGAAAALAVLVPGALAWSVGGPVVAAAIVLLSVGVLGAWIAVQPRRALGARSPVALRAQDAPRLVNVVAGLSADLGVPVPSLWVVEGQGANAVVGRLGGPAVGVTRSLLESYTRTELEAVVAHCLLRLRRNALRLEAFAAAVGPLGRWLCPVVDARGDGEVAAVTRYPPALASAIRKASPAEEGAPFLFVAPRPWHDDQEKRAAFVADL
jgi:hypothetical protein